MWFKYGLKAQKLQKQHALKGQKLLAQGITLGMMAISKTPCKGKSFMFCLGVLKLLPFQGDRFASVITQGDALGLGASALSGRMGQNLRNLD